MAEKKIKNNSVMTSSITTGYKDENMYLMKNLSNSFNKANRVDMIVSFLMESGVKLLVDEIKLALDKGKKIRILTSDYLDITQPSAIYLLRSHFGKKVEIRFFSDTTSFHPKSYIFSYADKKEIYIGSSNVSKGALTNSVEWNYRFTDEVDPISVIKATDTFIDLWENHSFDVTDEFLDNYAKNWKKPQILKYIEKNDDNEIKLFQPRGAQIEALYGLEKVMKDGANKALILCATGFGKTYTAAFFSKQFKRVLFAAHTEEILRQAKQSFKNVRPSNTLGSFNSVEKDIESDIIFASIPTLGKEKYLNNKYFKKDAFDLIIIDEVHHSVASNYENIIKYFQPQFLLGLTATPERLDGKDIFQAFDYIVAYEIDIKKAINRGMLVPFRYYGVYDNTIDYKNVKHINGKYDSKDLENKLNIKNRFELIYKNYMKYDSDRCLGFCSSRLHAEKMAEYFNSMGIASVAVYSSNTDLIENNLIEKSYKEDRVSAVNKLVKKEIKIIFSVDMFNEGVDIKELDMVMFLRPTESPTIFLQQLGRGLRISNDKEYLQVLDFIGNYRKMQMIPFLLSGEHYSKDKLSEYKPSKFDLPEDCFIDFDFQVIDIFKEMAEVDKTKRSMINDEYYRIKKILNHIPTRVELKNHMTDEMYNLCKKNSALNPFNNYFAFLYGIGETEYLTYDICSVNNSIAGDFLRLLETTRFTKSYKLPIMQAFIDNDKLKMKLSKEDIIKAYRGFYSTDVRIKDMMKSKDKENFKNWTDEKYFKEANKNPVRYLIESGNNFFIKEEGYPIALNEKLKEYSNNKSFISQMEDIIEYRVMDYFGE